MKPRLFTSFILFISAYSPLLWIICIKDFNFGEKGIWGWNNPIISIILLVLSILSIIILFLIACSMKGGNTVEVQSVNNKSVDIINYTIPYLISFFGFNLSSINDLFSLTVFMLLLFLMSLRSGILFLNPMLLLAGFGYYEIEYIFDGKNETKIVISKQILKKNCITQIKYLAPSIYINTNKYQNEE